MTQWHKHFRNPASIFGSINNFASVESYSKCSDLTVSSLRLRDSEAPGQKSVQRVSVRLYLQLQLYIFQSHSILFRINWETLTT